MNSNQKTLIRIIIAVLFFALGFFVAEYFSFPKKDSWGGDVYDLGNKRTLCIWYYDAGAIKEMSLKSPTKKIFGCQYFPNGVTKTTYRLIPNGSIFTSFFDDGKVKFIDTKQNGQEKYERKEFDKQGNLIVSENQKETPTSQQQ
jgi:hypothetical protein